MIGLPQKNSLLKNYPNLFNSTTAIEYNIANEGIVKLAVYDINGQCVRVLVDRFQTPGRYNFFWNGNNDSGLVVSSGVYFIRFDTMGNTETRKMLLMK